MVVGTVEASQITLYPQNETRLIRSTQANYSTIRNGTGTTANQNNEPVYLMGGTSSNTFINMRRDALPIKTSILNPDAIFDSVVLKSQIYSRTGNLFGTYNVTLTGGKLLKNITPAAADYQNFTNTELSNRVEWVDLVPGQIVSFTFNAAGLSYIDKTGYTVLYIRDGWDTLGAFDGVWANGNVSTVNVYAPYLVINYHTPYPPPVLSDLSGWPTPTQISWGWYNGPDITMVYKNGVFLHNVTGPVDPWTGLAPGTSYTISTRSCDLFEHCNATWVNKTVSTLTLYPERTANFTSNVTVGMSPLGVSFTDLSSALTNGWAWFFGDETYNQPWINVTATPGWIGRNYFSAVVLPNGHIVLTGGNTLGVKDGDTWRSTDGGVTWALMSSSSGWGARSNLASVAMPNGDVILTGGSIAGTTYMADVWKSTDEGATWTLINASAWPARSEHQMVVTLGGDIILYGGENSGIWYNDTWRSTDEGFSWDLINATMGNYPGRGEHQMVAMQDGSLIVTGGVTYASSGTYLNDTVRSIDNGTTWVMMNSSSGWTARFAQCMVAMPDNSVLLFGGKKDSPTTYFNDTWRSTDGGATWTLVNASSGFRHTDSPVCWAMPDGSVVAIGGRGSTPTVYSNYTWRLQPVGSNAQNPVHTYTSTNTTTIQKFYNVSLTASNTTGYTTLIKLNYIDAIAPPYAITNLENNTPTSSDVTWSWEWDEPDPIDTVLMIYQNNTFWKNSSHLTTSKAWTGLPSGTNMTFSSLTCYFLEGECNSTWVNKTALTAGYGPDCGWTPTPTPTSEWDASKSYPTDVFAGGWSLISLLVAVITISACFYVMTSVGSSGMPSETLISIAVSIVLGILVLVVCYYVMMWIGGAIAAI